MARRATTNWKFVQKMNRQQKDGTYPIYLTVTRVKRVEKATGISVPQNKWDERTQRVKGTYANAPILNKRLTDITKRLVDAITECELRSEPFIPEMLIEKAFNETEAPSLEYKSVLASYLASISLAENRLYRYTLTKLSEFYKRDSFLITEMTPKKMGEFSKWLTIAEGTKRTLFINIKAVVSHAVEIGLIEKSPLERFFPTRLFNNSNKVHYLTLDIIKRMKQKLYDMTLNIKYDKKGNIIWKFQDDAIERLRDKNSTEFALLQWLLCFWLNGLAPIDLHMLKQKDVKQIRVDGEPFYSMDITRQKTNRPVNLRIPMNMFAMIGIGVFESNDREYLYNVCSFTDRRCINQSHHWVTKAIKKVRKVLEDINKDLEKEDEFAELIDVENVTFYDARHSFANAYLDSPEASVRGLASAMGRSVAGLDTYVHAIRRDKELVKTSKMIDF